MEYNEDSGSLEVSIKFIGHDLEKALLVSGVPDLHLGTTNENDKTNDYLLKYINKHFTVTSNGEKLDFKFVGKEVNSDDFIYCFIESGRTDRPETVEIKNNLLTEVFEKQINTVYLKVGTKKVTYSLNKYKSTEERKL